MKNSKRFLMMILSVLTFVLVGLFAACTVTNSNDLNLCRRWIQASQKKAQVVEMSMEMKDSGVLVYAFEKTITFNTDDSATVKTVESSLNSAFVLDSKESVDTVENARKTNLLTISLSKDNFYAYDYVDGRLSILVEQDKVDDVFGWVTVESQGFVQITFKFSNQQLTSAACTFKTSTGKHVSCNVTYGY